MTYYRRDDQVINGIGQCVPNGSVTYFVQPTLALATCYNNSAGDEIVDNPQLTSGLGQTAVYLAAGIYTIQYSGPQILTETFPDQLVGPAGGGGGGSTVVPFEGMLAGTIDGVNTTFTLTNNGTPLTSAPTQVTVWLNIAEIPPTGYSWSGVTVVFATPPQPASGDAPADVVFARGLFIS